jgi:hypothetical protein
LSDGIRVRYLDVRDGCYRYIDTARELSFYMQSLERHFVQNDLIDIVRILADEPADVEAFALRLSFLRQSAPLFKFKVAVDHEEFMQKFGGEVTDFVPDFIAVCKDFDAIKTLQKGIEGKMHWYVCCGPDIPNTFIRSHLLESYAVILLTEYMGLDGFLRWGYTAWPEKPRERISYRAQVWPAGDTCFVYPSPAGKPLLTLRYMALLKGIQLFEIMQMLKDCNKEAGSIIDRVWQKVFKFKKLGEFCHGRKQKAGEFFSLEYGDYRDAVELMLDNMQAR